MMQNSSNEILPVFLTSNRFTMATISSFFLSTPSDFIESEMFCTSSVPVWSRSSVANASSSTSMRAGSDRTS